MVAASSRALASVQLPICHPFIAPRSRLPPSVVDSLDFTKCRGKSVVLSASGSITELQRLWHLRTSSGSFPLPSNSCRAGLLFAGAFVIKESPRWLFSRGRRDQAVKNLCWIRQLPKDHIYMQEEIHAIEHALEVQKNTVGLGFWEPFKAVVNNRKVTYRFLLGGSLFLWQNATGINAINYYSPTVFKSIGVTGTNTSLLTTGVFGVVKTVITLLWLFYLIDRLGRRKLLMYGAVGGSLCMWYIGGYIAVSDPASKVAADSTADTKLSSGGISAMVFFYIWTAVYTPSWNGTPWVLNSEMFDQNVRTLAQAFAAANNWFWNFMIARFTPQMFDSMYYGVYMFFASLMICSAIFVFFLIPETKGIPLEAMDRLFSREHSARNAHKIVLAEVRMDDQDFRRNSLQGQEDDSEKERYVAQDEKRMQDV